MAVNALIQFTQGPNTDIAGRAVIGTLTDGDVTITNGDNTDVASWTIDLLYVPPGASTAIATPFASGSNSSTPTALLPQPDARGCYRVRLTVYDQPNFVGTSNQDIRNFAVPEANGDINPPFQVFPPQLPYEGTGNPAEKPDELNFGGQPYGWAGDDDASRPMMFQNIRAVDRFKGFFSTAGERGSAVVLGGPNLPNPTRPVSDGSDLWIGMYPNSSTTFENGYARSSGTAELTVTFNEDQSFDYAGGGSNYYNSLVAYDSDNDRMIIVRMNRGNQSGELFVAALSKDVPAVKGPDTNLQAILTSPVSGFIMDVFTTPGYLWIIRSGEVLRVDLSNFSNVIRVYSPGFNLAGYHVYDPTDRYGDGEGRIWVIQQSYGLVRIKPSTGVVDLGPTQPNNPPTAYFFNTYGLGMDVTSGRMYAAIQGFMDSTSSTFMVAFDVDPLFDNLVYFDWQDAGNPDSQRLHGSNPPFDVVTPTAAGYVYALGNRLSDDKATFWVFQDTGLALNLHYSYAFGGGTLGPGLGTIPTSLGTSPIPPRFTFFPDATNGDTTFIAHPGNFGDGFVAGIRFTLPTSLGARPMAEGVDEFGQSVVAQLAGDLEPAFGMGSPESPVVTGMYGAQFNFSGISSGSLIVANVSEGVVSNWQDQLFPWGRSYRAVSGNTYQPGAADISMVVGMAAGGVATIRMPVHKGVPTSSFANQRVFVSAFGDQIGQAGSIFDVVVNPSDLSGNGEIYGIGSSSIPSYRVRNRHEALEFGWAYDSGIDPVGRWTVTNRYRPWENVEVTSTPTAIVPGKAVVQVRTSTGAKEAILSAYPFNDDWIVVKDVDGNASVNNITVTANSKTIDGSLSYVIDTDRGSALFRYSDVDGEWHVVSTNGGGAGGTDANAIHDNVTGEINAIAAKDYPTSSDLAIIEDAAASYAKKKVTLDNLPPFWDSRSFTLTAAQVDNYGNSFAGQASLLILTPNAGGTLLTGLNASVVVNSSYRKVLVNEGPDVLTLAHENVSSLANNRFNLPGGIDFPLQSGYAVILEYVSGKFQPVGETPVRISALTEKVSPVSADRLLVEDSADSFNRKFVQVGNLPGGGAVFNPITVSLGSSNQDNWNPTGWGDATYIRVSATVPVYISGAVPPTSNETRKIVNVGTANIELLHESTSSTVANRFNTASDPRYQLKPGEGVTIVYDSTSTRWRIEEFEGQYRYIGGASHAGGSVDNWAPSNWDECTNFNVTLNTANLTVTGMAAGVKKGAYRKVIRAQETNGERLLILSHQNASSLGANRFTCPNRADVVLRAGQACILEYLDDWNVVGAPESMVNYTPATLAANANDYYGDVLFSWAGGKLIRLSASTPVNITGLYFVSQYVGMLEKKLVNVGANTITLIHESASSTAINRIISPTGADYPLASGQIVDATYDEVSQRWRLG